MRVDTSVGWWLLIGLWFPTACGMGTEVGNGLDSEPDRRDPAVVDHSEAPQAIEHGESEELEEPATSGLPDDAAIGAEEGPQPAADPQPGAPDQADPGGDGASTGGDQEESQADRVDDVDGSLEPRNSASAPPPAAVPSGGGGASVADGSQAPESPSESPPESPAVDASGAGSHVGIGPPGSDDQSAEIFAEGLTGANAVWLLGEPCVYALLFPRAESVTVFELARDAPGALTVVVEPWSGGSWVRVETAGMPRVLLTQVLPDEWEMRDRSAGWPMIDVECAPAVDAGAAQVRVHDLNIDLTWQTIDGHPATIQLSDGSSDYVLELQGPQ